MDPWVLLLLEIVLGLVALFFVMLLLFGAIAAYMYHWEPIKGGIEEGGLMTILGITSFSNNSTPGNATPFTAIWRNITNVAEYREGTLAQLRICKEDLKQQIRGLQTLDGKPRDLEAAKKLNILRPTLIALCNMGEHASHCRLLVGRSLSGKVHFLYQYGHLDPLPRYGLVNKNIGAEWVWQLLTRTTRLIVPVYMTDISMAVTKSWRPISDLPVGGQWHCICPVIFQKGAVTEPFIPPPPALAVEQLAKNTKINKAVFEAPIIGRRNQEVENELKQGHATNAKLVKQMDQMNRGASLLHLEPQLFKFLGEALTMRMVMLIIGCTVVAAIGGAYITGTTQGTVLSTIIGLMFGAFISLSGTLPGVSRS